MEYISASDMSNTISVVSMALHFSFPSVIQHYKGCSSRLLHFSAPDSVGETLGDVISADDGNQSVVERQQDTPYFLFPVRQGMAKQRREKKKQDCSSASSNLFGRGCFLSLTRIYISVTIQPEIINVK